MFCIFTTLLFASMNQTILKLLNIKPTEVWLVKNLFILNLFQSIGMAMLFTLSNALFLAQFDVSELPRIYMLSAIILLLANFIYAKLEHKIPIQKLILYVLLLAVVSILLLRLMIYRMHYEFAPVLLLIWYQVIYLLCGNSFWALAAQVFDVRESKRTFSILSAGDTPAKLLGYLSISAFAGTIGLNNFLFIAVLCFAMAFLFMQRIVRANRVDFNQLSVQTSHTSSIHNNGTKGGWNIIEGIFENRLILLISLLSFIVAVSLTVVDFTFLSEVKTKYKDDVALASFLASFLAVGRLIAILAKMTLTSRIEEQLGIKRSLLILPVLLIFFAAFILISERVENDFKYFLYIFGSMVVMTEVLKSVLQEPLILVLFQPLKPLLRLKGHTVSKGILAPIGLFSAGLFIYLNIEWSGSMNILNTSFLLLVMCTLWIIAIYLLDVSYAKTLISSLKQGFFRGNVFLSNDIEVKSVLLEKLKSDRPLEVIYAADTLEKVSQSDFNSSISLLLSHDNDDVKKYAIKKIQVKNLQQLMPELRAMLMDDISIEVRIDCLVTLSNFGENKVSSLAACLDQSDHTIQQQAIVALFASGDLDGLLTAGKKLSSWINSSEEKERILAAETIGKFSGQGFHHSILRLLNDHSIAVQNAAIKSASKEKSLKLVPLLIEKLKQPTAVLAAADSLVAYGEDIISYLPSVNNLKSTDTKLAIKYIKIATHIKGENATAYLEQVLLAGQGLKSEVIAALKERGYIASTNMRPSLFQILLSELEIAMAVTGYIKSLKQANSAKIVSSALFSELKKCELNIFYLLSFLYARQKLLQAYNSICTGKKDNIANAIETIDIGVSKSISTKFIPIIEFLHYDHPHISDLVPEKAYIIGQLKDIIHCYPAKIGSWTTATAIYTLHQFHTPECSTILANFNSNGNQLLEETRNFALSNQT